MDISELIVHTVWNKQYLKLSSYFMEALHSPLTTGEQSGGLEKQNETPVDSPQPHLVPQYHEQNKVVTEQQHAQQQKQQHLNIERKRLRLQRKTAQETETVEDGTSQRRSECLDTNMRQPSEMPSGAASSAVSAIPSCSTDEALEGTPRQKRERKPQKPGKYVCSYCGRACAKPSVLQKHIRSHTGERPYPCAPCGFSFKTKSNLYKHRKSHTHRVKAGLTAETEGPGISFSEEPLTESDEESQPSSFLEKQRMSIEKSNVTDKGSEGQLQGIEDSHAVKKRLAMRLSRGRRTPIGSSDEASSSFGLSSKGSTESGYFSRSESTEVSQDSPPNTSAKSYAEVILGKFGRLGHLQRNAHEQHGNPAGQEGKRIPFTVPKKQVIDHITKLITINEAVVDTSKIDSVKPRRFSLSRRSSTEVKPTSSKESFLHSPKEIDLSAKSSGSITLGVPCEKFQHHSLSIQQADPTTTAPLLRSHSMPSDAGVSDVSETSRSLRLSQSFDDQQPVQNRRHGMLRRQPAIELPIGAEMTMEEQSYSSSPLHPSVSTVPDPSLKQESFECDACSIVFTDWERYQTHKQHCCMVHISQQTESQVYQVEEPTRTHTTRPGAFAFRKRRKEESVELEDPSLPSVSYIPLKGYKPSCEQPVKGTTHEHGTEGALKGISVIQHTSSFEKHDSTLKTPGPDEVSHSHDVSHCSPYSQSKQQASKPSFRKLVRQHNVQVPEILVTEDSNTNIMAASPPPTVPKIKDVEKVSEFQWPQRSTTLAQLPIEKLPPKKKRLRLAEAAQSSGDSSFESMSLPHSPSQDSCVSHTSSRSTSFEEACKGDADTTPTRRSRATHTLTIPTNSHREMRRSASEQAPHVPQHANLITETRSKSFDYSSLSPDRTPAGWRERRKCLLMRHSAVREPEEEDQSSKAINTSYPTRRTNTSPSYSPGTSYSPTTTHLVTLSNTLHSFGEKQAMQSQYVLSENTQQNALQLTPMIHTDQLTTVGSLLCPSGAARAHYSSMSTGLKLEIPLENELVNSDTRVNQPYLTHYHHQNLDFDVTSNPEPLRPLPAQRIPVRLNSHLPHYAGSIYTTVSQTFTARPQEPCCSGVSSVAVASKFEIMDQQPISDGSKSASAGATKRVLSPTNSEELIPESEQQQKRVKEEEDNQENESRNDKVLIECKKEDRLGEQSVIFPIEHKEPSFPNLNTNLNFSWCYLNYIKPNPSIQSEQQNSVYSSWCTSTRNPYPPGLTSKDMLSLLHCKQRHSGLIYTTADMSPSLDRKQETPDSQKPNVTEVHATQPTEPKETQQAELTEAEKKTSEKKEDQLFTSKYSSRVQICEGGFRSSEEYVYVRGRGRGRYVCEECGIRCKKPSMLRKHIRLHTDARPYVCQHCNIAFKTKGNLTKHMKSKAHGKRCPEGTAPGPVQCELETDEGGDSDKHLLETELVEEHQFSDAEETDVDEPEDNDEGDEQVSCSSSSSKTPSLSRDPPGSCGVSGLSNPGWEQHPKAPVSMSPRKPSHYGEASSPKTTKSVVTLPLLEPAAGKCSSPVRSLSPGLQMSPALPQSPGRCPSPRLSLSLASCLSSLSASNHPASSFPERRVSPIRALSPIQPVSPSCPLALTVGASVTIQYPADKPRDSTKAPSSRLHLKTKLEKTHSPQRRTGMTQSWPPAQGCLSRNTQPREGQRVLSHLPLHSQPQVMIPSLSLTIPIGGIQMVQPRSNMLLRSASLNHSVAQMTVTVLTKEKGADGSPAGEVPHPRNQLIVFTEPVVEMSSKSDASSDEGVVQAELVSKKREVPSVPMTTWKSISQRNNRKNSRSPKKAQPVDASRTSMDAKC
ncbi:transcription factor HIVEP3-like isoform X1 [Cyprinus carpio]|uniref:Transcription factor HIVEP3-like isoform X1 n=2 Tax=Cyprinus carpio TaxID=7962 RepID=A0A9R0AJ23_CYPCA|nr:transcription factor HIVEP3-like isoform X1 [Cyprinus carpio]XP_042600640.1 transcription factor HIVEP3-like isoform X1 [Cyprinus carpio]XP_042600642.1 transcription factor HIVEP3-like isoform X1 [Cyprinus carpio]